VTAVIRRVDGGDLDRIHQINEANVPDVNSIEPSRWGDLVADCALALVVEPHDADEIAGFCFVFGQGAEYASVNFRWFMDRFDDAMYLDRVAFDERFHGLGLGTLLYAEVDRILATDFPEMTRLTLEVNVDPPNRQSMAFHTRRGFVEVGRQVTDYGFEVSLMQRAIPFV
jgi:predicted GNAT superfamily acetyltransferase